MEDNNVKKNVNVDAANDEDQIFGDNNQPAPMSEQAIEEREKSAELDPESGERRYRDIAGEASTTRRKLNEKMNEVRDHGADARETPIR